jgi:hypothetical protein
MEKPENQIKLLGLTPEPDSSRNFYLPPHLEQDCSLNFEKEFSSPTSEAIDVYHSVYPNSYHKDPKVTISDVWKTGGFTFLNSCELEWPVIYSADRPDIIRFVIIYKNLMLASKTFIKDDTFGKHQIPYGYVKPDETFREALTRLMLALFNYQVEPEDNFSYDIEAGGEGEDTTEEETELIKIENFINYERIAKSARVYSPKGWETSVLLELNDDDEHPLSNPNYGDYWYWMDASTVNFTDVVPETTLIVLRCGTFNAHRYSFCLKEVVSLNDPLPIHAILENETSTGNFKRLMVDFRRILIFPKISTNRGNELWVKKDGVKEFLNKILSQTPERLEQSRKTHFREIIVSDSEGEDSWGEFNNGVDEDDWASDD